MAVNVLGSVTKVFDSLWITRSASGEKVANSTSLRAAQLVIENASPNTQFLHWNRDVNPAGVERWVAVERTARAPGLPKRNTESSAAQATEEIGVTRAAPSGIQSAGLGSFAGFGAGLKSTFKK